MVSAGKWFAEEMEDTGLQTAEDSKFFGIASSIESFSNEGKELIIQQPETSYAAHTGQFGQIVGMLHVVTHSIRLVIKKRVIVNKITVVAQDARVKK